MELSACWLSPSSQELPTIAILPFPNFNPSFPREDTAVLELEVEEILEDIALLIGLARQTTEIWRPFMGFRVGHCFRSDNPWKTLVTDCKAKLPIFFWK